MLEITFYKSEHMKKVTVKYVVEQKLEFCDNVCDVKKKKVVIFSTKIV
jgi:hypothetical protein